MDFIKIDKEKWQRKKVFELYSKDVPCTYSMTINLDITGLKNKIEIKQLYNKKCSHKLEKLFYCFCS